MWARQMELMVGLWLLVSPFVFSHEPDARFLWTHDLGVGAFVCVVALASHWHRLWRAHLVLLPVACWLAIAGWWGTRGGGEHPPPAYQSWILTGMLLGMFAIVPPNASQPPRAWRDGEAPRGEGNPGIR